MKKIICKPAPEVEIECGGELILLRFDLYSAINLQEYSEGGLNEVLTRSLPELAVAIVYAAGVNNNENFTRDKAREMVSFMSVKDITEIIEMYSESMGVEKNAATEEYAKNLMAQFLKSLK